MLKLLHLRLTRRYPVRVILTAASGLLAMKNSVRVSAPRVNGK